MGYSPWSSRRVKHDLVTKQRVYWVAMENVFPIVDYCQKSLTVTVLGAASKSHRKQKKTLLMTTDMTTGLFSSQGKPHLSHSQENKYFSTGKNDIQMHMNLQDDKKKISTMEQQKYKRKNRKLPVKTERQKQNPKFPLTDEQMNVLYSYGGQLFGN